jgi:hypothetical protein
LLDLSPEEIAVLRTLADAGSPVAEGGLDQSALRTLQVRRFLRRLGGFSVITPDGRRALQATESGNAVRPAGPSRDRLDPGTRPAAPAAIPQEEALAAGAPARLNPLQEDVLRKLALEASPRPVDDLDGRVLRALEGRDLVRRVEGRVQVTPAGRAYYETHVRRRRRARGAWTKVAPEVEAAGERTKRAASIREAVDALRRAISGTEPLFIGEMQASAEEAFDGLKGLADRIERGADPRRIPG